jgi:hypothetical protein
MFLINEYGNVKVSPRRHNALIFGTCSPFCCPKTSFVNLSCKRDRIQPFMCVSSSMWVFVNTVLKYCVLVSVIKIYFYRNIIRWFMSVCMWRTPCRALLGLCGCTYQGCRIHELLLHMWTVLVHQDSIVSYATWYHTAKTCKDQIFWRWTVCFCPKFLFPFHYALVRRLV